MAKILSPLNFASTIKVEITMMVIKAQEAVVPIKVMIKGQKDEEASHDDKKDHEDKITICHKTKKGNTVTLKFRHQLWALILIMEIT